MGQVLAYVVDWSFVDEKDKLLGIVSYLDVLRALAPSAV